MDKRKGGEDAFIRCCHYLIEMVMKYREEILTEAEESQEEVQVCFFQNY